MIYAMEEYQRVAEMMPGSVIIFQLDERDNMKLLFYSDKARGLTGLKKEELNNTVKDDAFNLIIKDDRKVIIEKIKTAIYNDDELDVVYRQYHKSNGFVWVHMKANIVGEKDGLPVFLASMLDVSSEMSNSHGILEESDKAICVIEKETKLLLYGNAQFYKLTDLHPSETMGVYCYNVLCGNPTFKTDNNCLCFATIDLEKPFEYYNPASGKYLSMYGRKIIWGEHEAYVFYMADQTEEKFKDKQLKNAQERFEMTLDNSGLFIWEYDIVNNQCINSQKAVRDYGIPLVIDNYPESLYEMGHTPPETVEQIKEVKQRLLNGETGFSVERRTIDINGNSQWMKVDYTLEKDANGNPLRALICGSDITEQKKKELHYEEEIRRKKTVTGDSKILAILDLTKDEIAENDADNLELLECLKLGSINSIMNAVCDLFVCEGDQEKYRTYFTRESMLDNYASGIMHGSLIHQFAHLPGWYESTYDLVLNPISGNVEAVTSMRNVTDLVRSEQVVKKLTSTDYEMIITIDLISKEIHNFSKNEFTEFFSTSNTFDEEFRRKYIEYIRNHCIESDVERILQETSLENIMAKLEKMPIYSNTYTAKNKDEIIKERSIFTYLDESKKTLLCARQDITEAYKQEEKQKRELTAALERAEIANRAKTNFLSRVSHDMRTPLNGILGLTSLMKDEDIKPSVARDLSKLEISGKYLLELINDVLDVSSIEADKMELHPTVCDGKLVIYNIIKLAKPNMDGKDIDFITDIDTLPLIPLYIDESRLQQIAMNLLGNAAKFTPKGGQVEFIGRNIYRDNNIIRDEFIIRDNGIGMSEDYLPHLFEPFSQENGANTNAKDGTGLGMSITKKIVELMNGSISVESELGKGTAITISLEFPIATEKQIEEWQTSINHEIKEYELEGKIVLLCEDHPLNREIAKRMLSKIGVIVEHAGNGKEGVELFNNSPINYYDAILMDIRMPVMDGLDATRKIRQLSRKDAKSVPILAMTANALGEDIKRTIDAGMNAHLSKPMSPENLYLNLQKFISQREE